MVVFEQIHQLAGSLSAWISVVSAVFALLAWLKGRRIRADQIREAKRRAEKIELVLKTKDGKVHVLQYQPRRDQASRGEVLGILGMYSGEPRFKSDQLVPLLESGEFDRMLAGELDHLDIVVTNDDFERLRRRDLELGPATDTTE